MGVRVDVGRKEYTNVFVRKLKKDKLNTNLILTG